MTRLIALIIGRIRWWKWLHWDAPGPIGWATCDPNEHRDMIDQWLACEPAEWRPK